MTERSARERILDTALKLFLRDGFHATGVDTIVREANVAKMTLYKHFQSKDILIEEVLKKRDDDWLASLEVYLKENANTPRQKLLAIFDSLELWFSQEDFYGCAFINAATEHSNEQARGRILSLCSEHKAKITQLIHQLATAAQLKKPKELAEELSLIIEGAIVLALIHQDPEIAQKARKTAKDLISQHAGK